MRSLISSLCGELSLLFGGRPRPRFAGGADAAPFLHFDAAPAEAPAAAAVPAPRSSEDLEAAAEATETESALEASWREVEEVEAHSDLARFRFIAARSKLEEIFFSICFAAWEKGEEGEGGGEEEEEEEEGKEIEEEKKGEKKEEVNKKKKKKKKKKKEKKR